MPKAVWTPTAEAELEEIAYYIAVKDNRPRTARRLIDDVHTKIQKYADQPGMGVRRDDLGEGFRICPHKRYLIVYRVIDGGIEILRVIDGARDYPSLFL